METLKLSDSFVKKCDTLDLEVNVTVINVNYEKGAEILERCKTLREYSEFIHLIREKQSNGYDLKSAIEESIKECMENDVLREFLKGRGGDVVSFLFEELTRAECGAIREEDGYVRGLAEGELKGLAKGKAQGIAQGKAEGITEGDLKRKLTTAAKMKRAGESIEKIALYTELEPEEIEKL